MSFERVLRWALVSIAIVGLAAGILAYVAGRPGLADLCWTLATAPVMAGLAVSIVRDFLAGRFGVDAIALVSMSAALALGQPLAGAVAPGHPGYGRWRDQSGMVTGGIGGANFKVMR